MTFKYLNLSKLTVFLTWIFSFKSWNFDRKICWLSRNCNLSGGTFYFEPPCIVKDYGAVHLRRRSSQQRLQLLYSASSLSWQRQSVLTVYEENTATQILVSALDFREVCICCECRGFHFMSWLRECFCVLIRPPGTLVPGGLTFYCRCFFRPPER